MALAFAAIGLWALLAPVGALGTVGVAPQDTAGLVELRAMYGGLELGAAAFFAWCAADRRQIRSGLWATVAMVGGLGSVRALGLLLDRPALGLQHAFAALELSGTALAVFLLLRGVGRSER